MSAAPSPVRVLSATIPIFSGPLRTPKVRGPHGGAPTWSDHEAAPRGERGGAEPEDGEAAGQDGTLSENTLNSERPLSEGRGRHIKARPDRDVQRKEGTLSPPRVV